jgi:predicted glycosyltransferase
MSSLRVMMCPINGIGLGHVQRCVLIAEELRKQASVEITFVSNTLYPQVITMAGFGCVGLPQTWKDLTANVGAKALPLQEGVVAEEMRDELFGSVLNIIRPDITVFDPPVSVAMMGLAREKGARVVAILRQNKGYFDAVARRGAADLVILPSDAPGDSGDSLVSTGPVFRALVLSRGAELRQQYFPAFSTAVLVCQGGGGVTPATCNYVRRQGHTFLDVVLTTLRPLAPRFPIHVLVSTGPFCPLPRPLLPCLHEPWLSQLSYLPSLPDLMAAVDLVISTAGYNSANEIYAAQVPAVLLPIDFDVESQALNVPCAPGMRVLDGFNGQQLAAYVMEFLQNSSVRQKEVEDAKTRHARAPGQVAAADAVLRLAHTSDRR